MHAARLCRMNTHAGGINQFLKQSTVITSFRTNIFHWIFVVL